MPPFNRREVIRYFVWVAVIAVALGAMIWFLFYGPGQQQIHLRRGTSSALQRPSTSPPA